MNGLERDGRKNGGSIRICFEDALGPRVWMFIRSGGGL